MKRKTKALLAEWDVEEFDWIKKEKAEKLAIINKFITITKQIKSNEVSVYDNFAYDIIALVKIMKITLPYILLYKNNVKHSYNELNLKLFYEGKNCIASLIKKFYERMVEANSLFKLADFKKNSKDYFEFQCELLNKLKEIDHLEFANFHWIVQWYINDEYIEDLKILSINDWMSKLSYAVQCWSDDLENELAEISNLTEEQKDAIDDFLSII